MAGRWVRRRESVPFAPAVTVGFRGFAHVRQQAQGEAAHPLRKGTRVRSIAIYVDGRRAKTVRGARKYVSVEPAAVASAARCACW